MPTIEKGAIPILKLCDGKHTDRNYVFIGGEKALQPASISCSILLLNKQLYQLGSKLMTDEVEENGVVSSFCSCKRVDRQLFVVKPSTKILLLNCASHVVRAHELETDQIFIHEHLYVNISLKKKKNNRILSDSSSRSNITCLNISLVISYRIFVCEMKQTKLIVNPVKT